MRKNTSTLMVLNRRANLASTLGHVISFFKGEPVAVPRILMRDAINMGAVPFDKKINVEEELVETRPSQPVDPAERLDDIAVVIEAMVDDNIREDFTAAGTPNINRVSARVGYKADRTEVLAAWSARSIALAEENEA